MFNQQTVTQIRFVSYDWGRPFDPKEYRSPTAARLLYEAALQAKRELEETRRRVEDLTAENREQDKQLAVLSARQASIRRLRWLPFGIQLVAVICTGIGVNLWTEGDVSGVAWVVVAVVLEIIAFAAVGMEG